ncbi:WD domain, G-beta repeat [Planctomycetes bacterium Pan216]|uniref:WD domain, G-beta repeat n=1 Tax=Kolteria novifilia TaxID=2527975 RepID=A0A518B7K5_9BACT|nr:WD domain, G-beta repeat [Planctomycetes bacterium Pan216]
MIAAVLLAVLWGAEPLDIPASVDPQLLVDAKGFTGASIQSIAFSPDARQLAVAGGKLVRIYDVASGRLLHTIRGYQEPAGYVIGKVNAVVFSPTGRFLITGVSDNSEYGSTRVFDLRDGGRLHKLLPGNLGCTTGIFLSNNGRYLTTNSCNGEYIFYAWDETKGDASIVARLHYTEIPTYPGQGWDLESAIDEELFFVQANLPPENGEPKFLAGVYQMSTGRPIGAPQELRRTGECLETALQRYQGNFAWTVKPEISDPRFIVMAGSIATPAGVDDYLVQLWDSQTMQLVASHEHRFYPVAVAYNARRHLVASADALSQIHVWDARTGRTIFSTSPQTLELYSVDWSRDQGALLYGTTPYPQDEFDFNHQGPLDKAFDLRLRRISQLRDPIAPPAFAGENQFSVSRPTPATPLSLYWRAPGSTSESLIVDGIRTGDVSTFLPLPPRVETPRGSIAVGTSSGRLYELEPSDDGGPWRIIRRCLGHEAEITKIALSPDQTMLATSSLDGSIRLWTLSGLRRGLGDVDFDTNGSKVTIVPPGSEAERLGFREDDVIVTFDGHPFYERIDALVDGNYTAGQAVDIQLARRDSDQPAPVGGQAGAWRRMNRRFTLQPAPDYDEPLLTIGLFHSGDWIVWAKSGHYDTSPGGEDQIGWHVNGKRWERATFHTVDQFRNLLYRPDVIDEILAVKNLPAAIARIKQKDAEQRKPRPSVALDSDLTKFETFENVEPPEVRILSPKDGEVVVANEALVEIEINTRSGLPMRKLEVRVNGKPPGRGFSTRGVARKGKRGVTVATQRVELDEGVNLISARAFNGRSWSSVDTVEIDQPAPVTPERKSGKKLYILAVGVSQYEDDGVNDLQFANRDAEKFSELLTANARGVYDEVTTFTLTDDDATGDQIKDHMDKIQKECSQAESDVTIILLLAGHGCFDQSDNWYFAPHDFKPDNMLRSGLSHAELTMWMNGIRATTLLVLDTCHAAGVLKRSGQPGMGVRGAHSAGASIWQGSPFLVIASCLPKEQSMELNSIRHGALTASFVESLQLCQPDVNKDGVLTIDELWLRVKDGVKKITGDRQHPQFHRPLHSVDIHMGRCR